MKQEWLLGPQSLSWHMTKERALLVGGGRALMLQACHPLVGAGVHQHSAFQSDPWSRLSRTSDFYLSLVYAKGEDIVLLNQWLHRAHQGVQGISPGGKPYRADQPDLMLWVQATLADSVAWAWQQIWGELRPDQLERYWQEQKIIGQAIGVEMDQLPEKWSGFQQWMDDQSRHLEKTPAGQAVMDHLQHLPVALPGIPRIIWNGSLPLSRTVSRRAIQAGLPSHLRREFGLEWTTEQEQDWQKTCRRLARVLRYIPSPLRHSHHARRALQEGAE